MTSNPDRLTLAAREFRAALDCFDAASSRLPAHLTSAADRVSVVFAGEVARAERAAALTHRSTAERDAAAFIVERKTLRLAAVNVAVVLSEVLSARGIPTSTSVPEVIDGKREPERVP